MDEEDKEYSQRLEYRTRKHFFGLFELSIKGMLLGLRIGKVDMTFINFIHNMVKKHMTNETESIKEFKIVYELTNELLNYPESFFDKIVGKKKRLVRQILMNIEPIREYLKNELNKSRPERLLGPEDREEVISIIKKYKKDRESFFYDLKKYGTLINEDPETAFELWKSIYEPHYTRLQILLERIDHSNIKYLDEYDEFKEFMEECDIDHAELRQKPSYIASVYSQLEKLLYRAQQELGIDVDEEMVEEVKEPSIPSIELPTAIRLIEETVKDLKGDLVNEIYKNIKMDMEYLGEKLEEVGWEDYYNTNKTMIDIFTKNYRDTDLLSDEHKRDYARFLDEIDGRIKRMKKKIEESKI